MHKSALVRDQQRYNRSDPFATAREANMLSTLRALTSSFYVLYFVFIFAPNNT